MQVESGARFFDVGLQGQFFGDDAGNAHGYECSIRTAISALSIFKRKKSFEFDKILGDDRIKLIKYKNKINSLI